MSDDELVEVLTLNEMSKYIGSLQRSGVAKLVKRGLFPKPVRLTTRRLVWIKSEIVEWQRARFAAARPVKREHLP
jgi:prophage regulatory protein